MSNKVRLKLQTKINIPSLRILRFEDGKMKTSQKNFELRFINNFSWTNIAVCKEKIKQWISKYDKIYKKYVSNIRYK